MRLSDKCALDTCDRHWIPGIAFIRNSYTYRYCSEDHLQAALSGLPWPKTLYKNAPEAADADR